MQILCGFFTINKYGLPSDLYNFVSYVVNPQATPPKQLNFSYSTTASLTFCLLGASNQFYCELGIWRYTGAKLIAYFSNVCHTT